VDHLDLGWWFGQMLAQVRGVHIWLCVIARVNLLTKLRRCSRGHHDRRRRERAWLLARFAVLLRMSVVLLVVAVWLYPTLAE